MMGVQPRKRDRSGERGIKRVDRVQDTEIFIDEYKDEKGRHVRLGKIRLSHEINNALKTIAHELKISKAGLVRAMFVGFIKDYGESKAAGIRQHFTPEKSIENWLQSRNVFSQLTNQLTEQTEYLEKNSKSPEVKILSRQLNLLAQMLNLTNKNVI